jgi:hypothetical protein
MSGAEPSKLSLELHFRGEPPFLHSLQFKSATGNDKVSDLQNRALPKAVATALLLFRTCSDLQFFRLRTTQANGSLVHTILNAKRQTQGKSSIRDLANGFFMQIFLKPTAPGGSYLDIDVSRLRPAAVRIIHDALVIDEPTILKNMASQIASSAGWDLNDYPLETRQREQHIEIPHFQQQDTFVSTSTPIDNPALTAIREAIRHFCEGGDDQHLRVGQVRSPAELEDLWAIDKEAYGEASITYEKFKDWWLSFPRGLHALFFRTRVMGAIGIWPLSARCAGLLSTARLKESQLTGRSMRTFINTPAHSWYISGIVLRPELIGGRAIKILLSHGIGSWLSSTQIQFPCELFALAYSDQGQALLEGFNFFKLQNAKAMPDNVPLFALQVGNEEHLVSSLKSRGLDLWPPMNKQSN